MKVRYAGRREKIHERNQGRRIAGEQHKTDSGSPKARRTGECQHIRIQWLA